MNKETLNNKKTAQLDIDGVNNRIWVATQIMNGFIINKAINHYGGDDIVRRDYKTDRKITAEEVQDEQIKHYTRIAFKIADSILKYGR